MKFPFTVDPAKPEIRREENGKVENKRSAALTISEWVRCLLRRPSAP